MCGECPCAHVWVTIWTYICTCMRRTEETLAVLLWRLSTFFFFLILRHGFSLAWNLLSRLGQLVPVSPPQGSSFLGFQMCATMSACFCWDARRRILFSMLSFYWLNYLNGPRPLLSAYLTVITPWDNNVSYATQEKEEGNAPLLCHPPRSAMCSQHSLGTRTQLCNWKEEWVSEHTAVFCLWEAGIRISDTHSGICSRNGLPSLVTEDSAHPVTAVVHKDGSSCPLLLLRSVLPHLLAFNIFCKQRMP